MSAKGDRKHGRLRALLGLLFSRAVGLGLLLGALTVAGIVGLRELRMIVLAKPAYSQTLSSVVLEGRPNWLPIDIAQDIQADMQLAADQQSIYSIDLAKAVHARALANPWVQSVQRVEKNIDGTIRVQAGFRRPFALVMAQQVGREKVEKVVVDRQGVVLPLPLARVQAGSYITINGVKQPPPPPGQKWPGQDIADGLGLLGLLRERRYAGEITEIDVRNHDGNLACEAQIRLHAAGPAGTTTVLFGRFPGMEYDLSPQEKLANLETVVAAQGGRLAGVRRIIDIQYDKPHVSLR